MKLGRVGIAGADGVEARLVAEAGDALVDLARAERVRLQRQGATEDAARRWAKGIFPGSMSRAMGAGPEFLAAARRALSNASDDDALDPSGVTWLSPVDPPLIRDCLAFEEHLLNSFGRLGIAVPSQFYDMPVYYKGNPGSIVGHDQTVVYPGYSQRLDYELELGFVIGRSGRNLTPAEARSHIFGVTIFNDFSARDIQSHEMGAMLGPSKSKDFCNSIGPLIATLDELDLSELTMVARVNSEEWSRGTSSDMIWSPEEIVSYISRCETIQPGELIGSGTVGRGCGLELDRHLQPGDVVELEVSGIGVLRNPLGEPEAVRWQPEPRRPD
jgi:2-keto-4-pentenoate hydratase/2-oxohepta-3-ene-1,7-dioic acid hydratase in catechol pathway